MTAIRRASAPVGRAGQAMPVTPDLGVQGRRGGPFPPAGAAAGTSRSDGCG
jgi:hypothetical protein